MSEFRIRSTDEARAYFDRIASLMVVLFSIPRDEAVGRVNQFWAAETFLADYELVTLLHQAPHHWAKTIYYGCKTWWLNEADLRPAPYPARPEEPR